ncbi:MAG: hypothetical protein ACR2HH_08875 [Chthoniobacterales bacterium]
MDKNAVKVVLQSYRGGTCDESDPIFREALAGLSNDPALAEWFQAEQEFDAVMAEKFRDIPVETAVKKRLLGEE